LALFICVTVIATAVTSYLFFYVSKRLNLCGKSLIITVSVLNALFCMLFPLLFAFLSGDSGDRSPSRGLGATFAILALWTVFYVILVVWRVALRSPALNLGIPIPSPDTPVISQNEARSDETDANPSKTAPEKDENDGIDDEYGKNTVDTIQNIDKMGMTIEFHEDSKTIEINILIDNAFDSLNAGRLEEAAEYFYSAIVKKPSLGLEIKIAIQLGMIYHELGHADLSLDILTNYRDKYQDQFTEEDKASIEAGINIIEAVVASIGGDVYEKD